MINYGIKLANGQVEPREEITEVTPELARHVSQYGETIVKIKNNGTEQEPIWIEEPLPNDEAQAVFVAVIQEHLDDFAKTRNYDNIMSAASYAASTVERFRLEGGYAVEMRDVIWAKGYEILNDVLSGQRPMPSIEEVLNELPSLEWPN